MARKMVLFSTWFFANPLRVRMAIFALLLALALIAAVAPGAIALADGNVIGGGH